MGLRQEVDIIQPMERMTSSGDRNQGCVVQVQVEHHEEIMLVACRPLWCQWTSEDVPKSDSPIVEYGGAII